MVFGFAKWIKSLVLTLRPYVGTLRSADYNVPLIRLLRSHLPNGTSHSQSHLRTSQNHQSNPPLRRTLQRPQRGFDTSAGAFVLSIIISTLERLNYSVHILSSLTESHRPTSLLLTILYIFSLALYRQENHSFPYSPDILLLLKDSYRPLSASLTLFGIVESAIHH